MEKMISFEHSRSTAHTDFNVRKSGSQMSRQQHIDHLAEELKRIDQQLYELRKELFDGNLDMARWEALAARINAMDCRRAAFVREIRDTLIAQRGPSDKMKRSVVEI